MGNGYPADRGEEARPPFPPYEGEAGAGFKRFVERRWPRSKILPQFHGESNDNYLARDFFAQQDYETWLRKSYESFITTPGYFVLPYSLRDVGEPNNTLTNYPPQNCRLKFPLNTGGVYSTGEFIAKFKISAGFIVEEDWIYKWNDIERQFPYENTTDKQNFLHQPLGEELINDDTEDFKEIWYNWFKSTWPCSANNMPDLTQRPEDFTQELQGLQSAYDEWVDENWTICVSRVPEERFYWQWPMPYERDTKGEAINVPPRQCQLLFGHVRTEAIIGRFPTAEGLYLGQDYKKIWVSLYYLRQETTHFGNLVRITQDIGNRVGDFQLLNIDQAPYDGIGNYFWGPGGKMGRNYPASFPPRFDKNLEGQINFGLAKDWPDPYDVVSKFILTNSRSLFPPSEALLSYWQHLIETFSRHNPKLYVPYYQTLGTDQEKKNYDTDRIGFKMFPKDHSYFVNKTWEMKSVDELFKEDLVEFDDWLFRQHKTLLTTVGVFLESEFYPDVAEYREWRRAVIQAIHLRYAERHHFEPWEIFKSDDTRSSLFPTKPQVDELARNLNFKWNWGEWVWADNFITVEQKQALKISDSPYNFPPFQSDIIRWETLFVICKTIQHIRKTSKEELDIKKLDDAFINEFGKFVWHYRRNLAPDNQILNVTSELTNFLRICNVNTVSSQKTWQDVFSYLLNNLYDHLIEKEPPIQLKKVGFCIIDPSIDLQNECTKYVDIPPENPYDHTINSPMSACKEFWRSQWLATEGLVDWPTYMVKDGIAQEIGSRIPVPDYWQKLWNTIFGYKPPQFGIEAPENGEDVRVVKGFILPTSPPGGYPKNVLDYFAFMRQWGMPVIRKKPPLLKQPEWERRIQKQWACYMEWVEANITAINEPHYANPYEFLKDKEGTTLIFKGQKQINCYPSFGVFPISEQTNYKWVFNPSSWTDEIFGEEDAFALLSYWAQELFDFVLEGLKKLVETIGGIFELGWVGIAILLGLGGVLLFRTNDRISAFSVDEKQFLEDRERKRRRLDLLHRYEK